MTDFRLTSPLPHGLDEVTRRADFWPTPRPAVEALLAGDAPGKSPWTVVLDPAAGNGAILRVLRDHGYRVAAVELREEERDGLEDLCPLEHEGWVVIADWLTYSAPLPGRINAIVTNPPFSIAPSFAEACLSRGVHYVALLLRCNTLGSSSWRKLWTTRPPTRIRPIRRPSFSGDGKTDAAEYAWFVWVEGEPAINLGPA